MAEQSYETALEVTALIMHHPSTMEFTRAHMTARVEDLKTTLSEEIFDSAWARGQQMDLGDVINQLMER